MFHEDSAKENIRMPGNSGKILQPPAQSPQNTVEMEKVFVESRQPYELHKMSRSSLLSVLIQPTNGDSW